MSTRQLALVFPGQGSQSIGMLNAWRGHRVVEATIDEASSVLDMDLWELVEHGPAASLNSTINTQPVMVASSVALFRAWQALSAQTPRWAAGHSVGEISALAAAGALDFADALRLVRCRAQAMAQAVPAGSAGMAAVLGLDDACVEQLCRECAGAEVLEAVNYNAPGQVVVAGHQQAIERIRVQAKAAGAKMVFVLPVSGPFHSSLMRPAASAVAAHLAPLSAQEPLFPVLHNSTLGAATTAGLKTALVEHLTRPVPWVQTMRRFVADGVTHVLEIGPGEVLTNLTRRIAPQLRSLALNSPQALEAAGELLEAGVPTA